MAWWRALIGPVVDGVNGWLGRRHELKLAKHEVDLSKVKSEARIAEAHAQGAIDRLGQRQSANIDWEILSIKNSGWKDEYLTILLTASLVLVFLPWTQPYIVTGFESLENTPRWYQLSVLIVIGSAFGVRTFDNFMGLLPNRKRRKDTKEIE